MRLSIATKIFLAITGVMLAFAAPLGFSIFELHQAGRRAQLINHGYLRLTLAFAEMETIQANARVILDRASDERELHLLRNAFTRFQHGVFDKPTCSASSAKDRRELSSSNRMILWSMRSRCIRSPSVEFSRSIVLQNQ